MTGHRSWNADRAARLADPKIAQRAVEARADLARYERAYQCMEANPSPASDRCSPSSEPSRMMTETSERPCDVPRQEVGREDSP